MINPGRASSTAKKKMPVRNQSSMGDIINTRVGIRAKNLCGICKLSHQPGENQIRKGEML
jgi:hypothetical protein